MRGRVVTSLTICFFLLLGATSSSLSSVDSILFVEGNSESQQDDAWLHLELLSWDANQSYEWENDGTNPDPQFRVCIDVDGESDGISPMCSMTQVWDDVLTLGSEWNTTFDLPEDTSILNLTIECWDNDEANDEWGNGPDTCDINPSVSEWILYSEFNWTAATTVDFSGDGSLDNDTEWGNAETSWRATIIWYGDEDSDGVSDNVDNCHGSTINLEVDEWGCTWKQYDWDDDGINNSEDPCPKITDEYCGTEGQYIATSRLQLGHGNHPRFVSHRNPLGQYDISPDGEKIALLIENRGIVVVNLSKITPSYAGHTWILNIWNSGDEPSSSWADYGTPDFLLTGPENEDSMMKFTTDSQTLMVYRGERIHLYETNPFDYSGSGAQPYADFGIGNCDSVELGQICDDADMMMNLRQSYIWITQQLRPDGLSISYDWENQLVRLFNANSPEITLQTIQIPFHDLFRIDSTNDGHSVVLFSAKFAEECNYEFCMDDYAIELYNISTGQSREITLNLPLAANNSNLHGVEAIEEVSISENGLRMVVVYREFNGGSVLNRYQPIQIFERDRDSDGFVDTKDLCPTEPGEIFGCLEEFFDTDGDGINDRDDQCPGTTDGANVDSTGCAATQLDGDSDGISDATDQCPITPNGESVGLNGCSSSQVDSDGDGLYDSSDDCPSTPDGAMIDANGCAEGDVVDLDSDSDGVRDSVDQCSNTDSGVIVDSSGCETEGDVQGTSNEELSDDAYAFIGCLVLIGIIAAIAFVVRSVKTPTRTSSYDYGRDRITSVSRPKPDSPSVDMESVMEELEQQRAQAQKEAQRLRSELDEQSVSASQMAKMQADLANLLQRVEDSEQVKQQMEQEMEEMRKRGDSSFLMQDSVVGGDSLVGSTKIESQTINDPEAIARAAIEAYRMAKSEEKD